MKLEVAACDYGMYLGCACQRKRSYLVKATLALVPSLEIFGCNLTVARMKLEVAACDNGMYRGSACQRERSYLMKATLALVTPPPPRFSNVS